jgi:hypothetical protein
MRVANELKKRGLTVSPSGVRRIWLRHDLSTMARRLKAAEPKIAQDVGLLTESPLAALEKAETDKAASGEFESEHAKLARIVSDRSVVDPTAATDDKAVPVTGAISSDVALANALKTKLLNDFETQLLNDLQARSFTFCSHPPPLPARAKSPASAVNAADAALHPKPHHDASTASAPVVSPIAAAPVARSEKPALQRERPGITVWFRSKKRAPAISLPPAPLTNASGQAAKEKSGLAKAVLRLTTAAPPAITDIATADASDDREDRAVMSSAAASDPSSFASTADWASLSWSKAADPQEDQLLRVALAGGATRQDAYHDERLPPEYPEALALYDDDHHGELPLLRSHPRPSLFSGAVLVAIVLAAGLTYMSARGERSVATSLITAADAAPAKIVPADNDQQKKLIRNLVNGGPSLDQAKLVTACDDKGPASPALSSGDDNNPIRVVEPVAPALDLPAKAGETHAEADHPATDVVGGSDERGQTPKKVRTFVIERDMPVVASKAADAGAGNLSPAVPPSPAIFPVSAVVDAGWDATSGETQMDAVINGKVSPIAVIADPLGINGGANKPAAAPSAGAAATRGGSAEQGSESVKDASGGAPASDNGAAATADASAGPTALPRASAPSTKRVVVANKAGKRLPTLPAITSSGNLY